MAFTVDQAFTRIAGAHEKGRLAHAFLIYGTEGDDLRHLAVKIVNLVNGWNAASVDDLRMRGANILEPEGKTRRILVASVRNFEKRFQLTSDANYKVGIVLDADRQNAESANAFLKTLEEPPPNTLLLLLTQYPDQLLETVRSRCVRVPLYRQGQHGMRLNSDQEVLLEALARHCIGEPSTGGALRLLKEFQSVLERIRERITEENETALEEEYEAYAKTTDGSWLKGRKEHYADLTESQYHEERSALLALLFIWFGEIMRRQAGADACDLPGYATVTAQIAQKFSPKEIQRRLSAIESLRRNLTTTVREPLALEVGFLNAFG